VRRATALGPTFWMPSGPGATLMGMIPYIRRPLGPVFAMLLAVLSTLSSAPAHAADSPLSPAVARLAATQPAETVVAWVRFTDRAGAERDPASAAQVLVSARSLERRARRGQAAGLLASDLPVHALQPEWKTTVADASRS